MQNESNQKLQLAGVGIIFIACIHQHQFPDLAAFYSAPVTPKELPDEAPTFETACELAHKTSSK